MKSSNIKRNMGRLTNSACALLFAGTLFVSCQDELLTGMPDWLGSSIYEELQARGEYETTLRLINDPVFAQEGLPTILAQTGSKTLFVAKDEAYARFFQSNPWGVHKYEDLSEAQKKLLLRTSLLDNAFLMELLSTTEATGGNTELGGGQALRHYTSLSLYDSVQVLKPADMPANKYWDKYRGKNMLVMRDATVPMLSHYLPAFMEQKQFSNDDVNFLTNGAYSDNASCYVSGNKVIEQDITCQNGYIHVLDNVLQPLTSMAEVIGGNPNYTVMKSFLDRFAFPELNESATREYNRLYNNGVAIDSVYTWRYLNNGFNDQRGNSVFTGDHQAVRTGDGSTTNAVNWTNVLPFDPGWNQFYNTVSDVKEDMGVFVVPTDDAFERYRNDQGTGTLLYNRYGSWDDVPDYIVAKLLQNLMKSSLISSVRSKFNTVLNTAQQSFFASQEDIDAIEACHLATNGVIYESSKVFSAPDYVSVSFPVMLDEGMQVINQAITDLQFNTYLNSMDSKYTFLPPTDNALSHYIDPVDIHKSADLQTYTRFYFSGDKIQCERFYMDDTPVSNPSLSNDAYIKDRIKDILNSSIIIGDVEDSLRMGLYVFTTKGGAPVVFDKGKVGAEIGVKGAGQIENGEDFITVPEEGYSNMTNSSGNGITCKLDVAPVMPASKSVLSVLADLKDQDPDHYEEFYNMLVNSTLASEVYDNGKTMSNGLTITAMNNYQYTVYVPTSESIKELYTAGVLPDYRTLEDDSILDEFSAEWADLINQWKNDPDADKRDEAKLELDAKIEEVVEERQALINSFLRYHIQNSAMYLGSNIKEASYETTLMDSENGRFYSLKVLPGSELGGPFTIMCKSYDGTEIEGVPARKVLNTENHFAREYHFHNASDGTFNNINDAEKIYNSSYAVVHSIDGPLLYKAGMLPGTASVNKSLRNKTKR